MRNFTTPQPVEIMSLSGRILPFGAFASPAIPLTSRVYLVMATMSGMDGRCSTSLRRLAWLTGVAGEVEVEEAMKKVRIARRALVRAGHVRAERHDGRWVYHITVPMLTDAQMGHWQAVAPDGTRYAQYVPEEDLDKRIDDLFQAAQVTIP